MSDILKNLNAITGKNFSGKPGELKDLIIAMEAYNTFNESSEENEFILSYLKDLNRIYLLEETPSTPKKKIASVIGVNPGKMPKEYGYSYSNAAYKKLRNFFKKKLYEDKVTEAWTGLSQGVDICFAHAVIELRELGFPIKLCCAIPFEDFGSNLKGVPLQVLNNVIRRADEVTTLSKEKYSVELLFKRSEYLIDKSDVVYMVCNNKSDFANCTNVIEKKNNAEFISVNTLKPLE